MADYDDDPMRRVLTIAAICGLAALILLWLLFFGFWTSLVLGVVVGVAVAVYLLMTDDGQGARPASSQPSDSAGRARSPASAGMDAATAPSAAELEATKPADPAPPPKPEPAPRAKEAPASGSGETKGAWSSEGAARPAAGSTTSPPPREEDGGGAETGEKPGTLDAPRGGKADDLKEIKGIGPKLEKMLNEMGIYHYDQIAGWSADEVAWVDENLVGFKGRVSRDEWVAQARRLAGGGAG